MIVIKYIEGTKAEDLSGMQFNKLYVKDFSHFKIFDNGNRRAYFNCKCDCGNDKNIIVSGASLKSGKVKSCGCSKKEEGIRKRKHNKYQIDNENNQVFFFLNDDTYFVIDLDDFDLVYDYYWHLDPNGYVVTKEHITQKTIRLHTLLCPNFIEVDHKNKNKLDNHKTNLREVTRQDNVINKPLSKNNASGFTGVYWNKKDQSWYSQIKFNKKCIHLGYTNTKEEAIIQRLKAELKYFGIEFAPQRHLFEEYGII